MIKVTARARARDFLFHPFCVFNRSKWKAGRRGVLCSVSWTRNTQRARAPRPKRLWISGCHRAVGTKTQTPTDDKTRSTRRVVPVPNVC